MENVEELKDIILFQDLVTDKMIVQKIHFLKFV